MSTDSICPICYENLGKIYRTLSCGHKFHHKCLKNCEKKDDTIHNCPYCRQEYENIILRKRITILSVEEKDIKKNFIKYMKEMLNMCESTNGKVPRLLICNKIFKNIINYI